MSLLRTPAPANGHVRLAIYASAAAVLCGLIVVLLAFAVGTHAVSAADRQLELRVHATSPGDLNGLMNGLSFVGDSWPMVGLTAAAVACCGVLQAPRAMGLVAASPAGASLIDSALKSLVHRPRPHLWPHAAVINSYSFPSGHAAISSAFFAAVTCAVWNLRGKPSGAFAACVSFVLVGGIGFSRIYLGVHWPTDVLAGYAVGIGWLSVLIVMIEGVSPFTRKREMLRGVAALTAKNRQVQ